MTVPPEPKTAPPRHSWVHLLTAVFGASIFGAAALAVSACARSGAAFLRIPVRVGEEHPGGAILVRLPCEALRSNMSGFDPVRAAYYYRGREPLPHELLDSDADGVPDAVMVVLPAQPPTLAGRPECWVVVVFPGPPSTGGNPPEDGSSRGVTVDFEHAVR